MGTTLWLWGSGGMTINGNIGDGSGAQLTLSGSMTNTTNNVILTGVNSYTGGTTLTSGVTEFSIPAPCRTGTAALPAPSLCRTRRHSQSARNSSAWTAGNIDTLLSTATFNSGSRLGIDTGAGNFTYTPASPLGTTQAGMGLSKSGTNMLILNGSNIYTGGTTVSGGTLQMGTATALGSNPGGLAVATGATLRSERKQPDRERRYQRPDRGGHRSPATPPARLP